MLLNEIVSNALDLMTIGENEFAKCYRLAQRGIRIMKWDFIGNIKTIQLNVSPNMTVQLPADFITERKIGSYNESSGEIATLTHNPDLSLLDASCENRFLEPSKYSKENLYDEIGDYDYDSGLPEAGFGYPNLGSNRNIGEYRIDRHKNLLVLNPNVTFSKLQIEYLGSTTKAGNCDVPEMVSEALVTWIIFQYNFARKGVSPADKSMYRREYYNELRKAKARIAALSSSAKNQSSRQSVTQSIKG